MKKITAFLALLALVALPASAMAAKTGDFEIGGYIKLHTWWDSTSMVNKNITAINVTGAGTSGRNNAFGIPTGAVQDDGPGYPVQLQNQGTRSLGCQDPGLY
jgi:hypothetical protein